ncbi:MAG: 1-phosphofructokinase [Eubacteriales bacterium]|nr:1-phosphofructokinase [Eubacteriales bacterium]
MIVTVTMNPAIDKTVEIGELIHGGLNRILKVEYDAGGKGINVSKTIRELGGESIATGFLGGNAGKTIENVLKERGIACDFIWVQGETRTNTKVFEKTGEVTELNEPGPDINASQMEELYARLEKYAGEDTLFILAGSIPNGVESNVYEKMIRLLHKKGAKVLLDADGKLFSQALEAGPDMIKPNRAELEGYMGIDYRASDKELCWTAKKLLDKGIDTVAVSMGRSGAMLVRRGYEVKCPALSVKAHSTVGAGDAMVAALAYSWDKKSGDEETMRLCMAASAGAVTTVGTKPPSRELVEELAEQVIIEKIGE